VRQQGRGKEEGRRGREGGEGSVVEALADDEEDEGHVVAVGRDDFAVFDDAADDLVGTFFGLELVVLVLDEVGLRGGRGTTSWMAMDWKTPSVERRMKSSLAGSMS
jgi:hypothetical protein